MKVEEEPEISKAMAKDKNQKCLHMGTPEAHISGHVLR